MAPYSLKTVMKDQRLILLPGGSAHYLLSAMFFYNSQSSVIAQKELQGDTCTEQSRVDRYPNNKNILSQSHAAPPCNHSDDVIRQRKNQKMTNRHKGWFI